MKECKQTKSCDETQSSNQNAANVYKNEYSNEKHKSYASACKETTANKNFEHKPTLTERTCEITLMTEQISNPVIFYKNVSHFLPFRRSLKGLLTEIDENLFNLSRDIPLALCLSEDLCMESGIACEFKRYFGGIGQLSDQNLKIGNVGLIINGRNEVAFYLITKKYNNDKTTKQALIIALKSLLEKMKIMKLTKLGLSKIGCNFDGLDWLEVKTIIASIFAGSGISIRICIPTKIFYRIPPPQVKVFITPKKIFEVEAKSDILLLIDLEQVKMKNWTNNLVEEVNFSYPSFKEKLLEDIRSKNLKPGDITTYFIKKEKIICVFTSQTSYWTSLEKAFINIKNVIKSYRCIAYQCGPINEADDCKHEKQMVMILRSIMYGSELWLCGNTQQTTDKEIFDYYYRNLTNNAKLSFRPIDNHRQKSGDPSSHNKQSNNKIWRRTLSKKHPQRK